jgi:hypothetical protein
LSPEIRTLDQIRVVARAQEIPHEGAFCDLVWSDPEDVDTWAVSPRGAGWLFGDKVSSEVRHPLSFLPHVTNNISVQPRKRPATHSTSASTGQRRLQVPLQRQGCRDRMVSTELLLPLRKRRIHHEPGRGSQTGVPDLLRGTRSQARCSGWTWRTRRVLLVRAGVWDVVLHTEWYKEKRLLFGKSCVHAGYEDEYPWFGNGMNVACMMNACTILH